MWEHSGRILLSVAQILYKVVMGKTRSKTRMILFTYTIYSFWPSASTDLVIQFSILPPELPQEHDSAISLGRTLLKHNHYRKKTTQNS